MKKMEERFELTAVRMYEEWKGKWKEETNLRRKVVEEAVPRRTKKRDWREMSRAVLCGITGGIERWEKRGEEGKQLRPWRGGIPSPVG